MSAGGAHTCGLRTDRAITCWGDNRRLQSEAPRGKFTAVSAGGAFTCALRTDRAIACWGDNRYGRTDAPSGTFTALSAGSNATCALRTSGTVTCWGESNYSGVEVSGTFTAVSAGFWYACGLRDNGTVACWGPNGIGQSEAPPRSLADGAPGQVAQGRILKTGFFACGVLGDGTTDCRWSGPSLSGIGDLILGVPETPPGDYVALVSQPDVDDRFMCLLRSDGQVR